MTRAPARRPMAHRDPRDKERPMHRMNRADGEKSRSARARNGFFPRTRSIVPVCWLALLAPGCAIDDRTPVVLDGGAAADQRVPSDASVSGSDAAIDRSALPDGAPGTDGPKPTMDAPPSSDTRTDAIGPGTGPDGAAPDTGSAGDTTPISDAPGPSPDRSIPPADGPTMPPTGQDGGGVVDAPIPPGDAGPTCPAPQIECGGKCVSPTDPKTCGSCTHDCTNLPHVSGPVTCQAGACVVPPGSCATGWAHCSTRVDDGCEVDITKPEHCGSCTTACTGATPLCAQNGADGGASAFQCKSMCSAPSPDLCGMSCVDKSTDELNCGTCGMACKVPLSHGQALCTAGMCDFQCNSNYTRCTDDCVDLNNDALNCQTCGHNCPPPTAHGRAICTSGACGFGCDSGFPNSCNGTCVNFQTDTANCGSCGGACQPPTNGTVTGCAGGQCQTACNDGYDKVGTACTQTRFYIADTGNDSNPGTETAPFLTWKRAATRASIVAGAKIYFKAGGFASNTTGEDFTTKIPDGATVGTLGGQVLIDGNGVAGFAFAGSGTVNGGTTVDGLLLKGFSEPFSASAGTQTLTNITLTEIQKPMFVSGTANMSINGFAMSSSDISAQFWLFGAKLSLSNGTLKSIVPSCLSGGPSSNVVEYAGALTANAVVSDGNLYVRDNGSATLTGVTLSSSCGSQNRSLSALNGTVSISGNSHVSQYAEFEASTIKARTTTFDGVVRINTAGTYDFGKSADKGNNTFNSSLWLAASTDIIANASGNHWIPNEPPADASGNIASSTMLPRPYTSANIRIDDPSSNVIF